MDSAFLPQSKCYFLHCLLSPPQEEVETEMSYISNLELLTVLKWASNGEHNYRNMLPKD